MIHRVRDLVKGLLAVILIPALIVGVPWLLLNVIGMPIGDLVADVTDSLASQSIRASAALRLGLSAIVWLAWSQIGWALMVELWAAGVGKVASRSRVVLPSVQRSARDLVAAAMLLLTVFSSSSAAATMAPLAAQTVAAPVEAAGFGQADGDSDDGDTDDGDTDDGESSADLAANVSPASQDGDGADAAAASDSPDPSGDDTVAPVEYEAQPGDTFWSLAEQRLGDGFRWREIRQLNIGRVMVDDSAITESTESLEPGWVLLVPATADSITPSPDVSGPVLPPSTGLEPDDVDTQEIDVVEGDHFWSLAEQTLTDAWGRRPTEAEVTPYWSQLVAANEGELLPPGDPDLIYPGQQFDLPPVPPDPETDIDSPAADSPATDSPPADSPVADDSGDPEDTADIDDAVERVTDAPVATVAGAATDLGAATDVEVGDAAGSGLESSVTATREATPVETAPASSTSNGGPSAPTADDEVDAEGSDLPTGVIAISGIGLVTAALGAVIARNQAKQLGNRRPGMTPQFNPPSSAQRLITETSDEAALDDLNRALRHIAAEMAAADLAMPDLVGALVEHDNIRLLIAAPHQGAPAPFRAERGNMVWTIDRPVPDLDVDGIQSPYPVLVSVGYTETAQLLVDLEYIGVMNLTGGFADIVDAMGTMALQLATSPLADTIDVVCVGFGEELRDLERVTVVSTLDTVNDRIDRHAQEVAALAEATDNAGPAGRSANVGDWTPMVVFDPLSELNEGTQQLIEAAGRTLGGGVCAVVTTADESALTMELTEHRVAIPAYRVSLDRRVLTRAERTELSSAVTDAKEPTQLDVPDLLAVLSDPALKPRAASARRHVGNNSDFVVRLLGPLRVDDRQGQSVPFARSATPEFLAYLSHHRDGVEVGRVMNTLWPATTARRTWIANVYADARRSLSQSGDGVSITPRAGADDEYRLSNQVSSDLDHFRRLVTEAIASELDVAQQYLTEALELVEGVPYSNITSRWPITEGYWQEATVMVDEAARCVAALALDQFDDPRLAEWATAKGLLASPQSVELHRLRLRAAIALDGARSESEGSDATGPSPDAVFQHYQAVVMADDDQPEGGSSLDVELVALYDSYRQSRLGHQDRQSDSDTLERQP